MSNDININSQSTEPDQPEIGLDHPTVEVEYPDGGSETVDPDYDIIIANDPHSLDADIGETRVTRLELTESNVDFTFDKQHIQHDVSDAVAVFESEYGYPLVDVCVETVYYRIVDDWRTLCVQLRGSKADRQKLSQLALHVDERLRTAY